MHSYIFGISSQKEEETNRLLDSVLVDANHKFFCGGSHVAIQGESCCDTDTQKCHILGKIDNQETLQNELKISQASISQAELFIKLFQKFEDKAFEKIEGNNVIIFLDKKKDKTYIFRPRDATSSIYFCEGVNSFVFASELKLLLRCDWVAKRLNNTAISAYLQLGFIPAPLTPIQNVIALLPGYLLTYHNEKVRLKKIHEQPSLQIDPKLTQKSADLFFDISKTLDHIFHLDLPQSVLFFPEIFEASATEKMQANASKLEKAELPFKPKPLSQFLKHLTPIFSKIYFSTHRKIPSYTHFKKTRVIFSKKELKKGFGKIANAFDDYSFFAKKHYEKGLETMPNILLQEDALFFPYIKHFKAWKDLAGFKAGLIERYQTNAKQLKQFITKEVQDFLVQSLHAGSLVDLDLLNPHFTSQMTPIQLWTTFILEIWIRLCIDSNPTQETLMKVHEDFNLRV